ncbi:MAG: GEVED domain-containing protein, partial [Chitinophagales bacterium]
MKKALLNFLTKGAVILLIALSTSVKGQVVYSIGDSAGFNTSTVYPTPFGDWYKTYRQQYLFLASELAAVGMGEGDITTITWWVIDDPLNTPGVTEGYTIKLKNTGTTDLGSAWDPDATVVYGPVDYTPTMGAWNSFELDAPFYWDGTSNLLLEVCGGLSTGTYTDNGQVGYASLGFNASRTYRSDTYASDVCAYPDAATTGTNPTRRPITRFTAAASEACSATPDAGAASSTATSVCADDAFTVSVAAVLGSGISYQWESSTDGDSWSAIGGATGANYLTTQSEATWYRCVITCEGFGSDASEPVYVGQNAPMDCYCTPVFTSILSGDYISYYEVGTIASASGEDADNYADYTADFSTDLTAGSTYTVTTDVGPIYDQAVKTYIDLNQNGVFEAEEELGCVLVDAGTGGATYSITIPVDAMPGTTRLRAICEWLGPCEGITACMVAAFGEAEDYTVNIIGEGACALVPPTDV